MSGMTGRGWLRLGAGALTVILAMLVVWLTWLTPATGPALSFLPGAAVARVGETKITYEEYNRRLEKRAGRQSLIKLIEVELIRQGARAQSLKTSPDEVEREIQLQKERDFSQPARWLDALTSEVERRRQIEDRLLAENLVAQVRTLTGDDFSFPTAKRQVVSSLAEQYPVAILLPDHQNLEFTLDRVKWEFSPQFANPIDPMTRQPAPGLQEALQAFSYGFVNLDLEAGRSTANQNLQTLREQFYFNRRRPSNYAYVKGASFKWLGSEPGKPEVKALGVIHYSDGGREGEFSLWLKTQYQENVGERAWRVIHVEPR